MSIAVQTEKTIFLEAAEIVSPTDRAAFLDRACAGEVQLRAAVEALLLSHQRSQGLLDATRVSLTERPGTMIGPYKLLQQIGEGGMGVVYMAEQTDPIARRVALKIIKPGMDTQQVIARFEAERQALALMDHVNIARVLDAGMTESGRPYFVMELVNGVPITKYCDDQRLTPRQRLELFVPVCQAIQHAHQKGIIHRDIKPSNVMVTLYDGKPVPKVIDFGVAKATEQKLTERTLFTQCGTMVGTLEYMSPEQAEMSALGVDTRSDIYSLGVLLYELLTGNTPLSHKTMKEAAYAEILRMIKEAEPQKPSTRLTDSGEALASISSNRHTEPAKLTKLMRGELDWIVMKTLEKDRNRRYETAIGFARDVQRYLADEPVLACPPSAVYRFRKFARRNKAALAMVTVVAAAVLALIAGTLVHNARLGVALDDAQTNLEKARRAEEQTHVAEQEKTRQLAIAHLREAQALRNGGLVGRRFESLVALKKAAEQFRALGQLDEKLTLELRKEAIACLALVDMKPGKEWTLDAGWSRPNDFDPTLQHYVVRSTADDHPENGEAQQGNLSIRRVADRQEIAYLPGFGVRATATAFSPDGNYMAAHYEWGQRFNYVWDVKGREAILKVPQGSLASFPAFSPDSRLAALARPDHSIRIYDLVSGATRDLSAGLPISSVCCFSVCFHPEGRQLTVVAGDTVQLRDVDSGKEVAAFKHPGTVVRLAWRSDGKVFATCCFDHDIFLWDVASPAQPLRILKGHFGAVVNLCFSHSGDLLFSNSWDSTDRLWDAMTGQQLVSRPGGVYREHLFGPDDQSLDDGWQVATGRECRTFHGHQSPPRWVAISPAGPLKGRLMASSSPEGVQLWDLAATRAGDKLLDTLTVCGSLAVHFDPGGQSLITDSKSAGLQCWPIVADPGTGGVMIGPPRSPGLSAQAPLIWPGYDPDFALSADGRTVAHCPVPGHALVFDLENPCQKLLIESPSLRHAAFSPDGRWLATGNWQGRGAKVWDAQTGMLAHDLDLGEPWLPSAWPAFSPDGKWLVIGTVPKYHFWEVHSWQQKHSLPRENAGRSRGWIVFSPDGRMLAVLHDTSEVRLVDPATGREFARLPTAGGPYCFSPDGSQLVTYAGRAGAIHVWDLRLIRRQLEEIDLDWDLPPYPPPLAERATPLRVKVLAAEPPPPSNELNAEAHFERGLLRLLLRQFAGATSDFNRASALNPKLSRRDEIARAYAQVCEQNPIDAEAHANLGRVLFEQKKLEEAIAACNEALRLKPDHAPAQESLIDVAWHFVACSDLKARDPMRAVELVKAVIAQNPDPELLASSAPMLLLADGAGTYRQLCARVIGKLGDTPEPRTAYLVARICALAPDAVPDATKLVEAAERAVRAEPVPHHLHTLGLAHFRAGQFDEAIEQLHKSIEGNWSANAANWLVLAMAHQRLGHADEAQKWLDKAVRWIDYTGLETPRNSVDALWSLHRHDSLACMVLRREAETLLGLQPQPAPDRKESPGEKK